MGKISEITVTKGKNIRLCGDREEWLRLEYSVKAVVEDDAEAQVAKATIEGLIDGWLSNVTSPKPQVQQQPQVQTPQPVQEQLEKLKKPFGDLADLLSFTVKDGKVLVKPRQFLGAENFSKVANVVRGLQGQYISEGKNSRFELPLPT